MSQFLPLHRNDRRHIDAVGWKPMIVQHDRCNATIPFEDQGTGIIPIPWEWLESRDGPCLATLPVIADDPIGQSTPPT